MPKLREAGSLWRRWDLHTHTPDTILADQYDGWEPFLRAIEEQNDVVAIGVTDYLTITNYRRMRREKAAGRIPGIQLLLPNIEFRITPATRHGRGINLHLLVSPDDPDHETQIDQALARLQFSYAGQNFSCTPNQLIALGRRFKPALADDRQALAEGANQFKIGFDAFRPWFKNEGWLQRNALVVLDGGQQDGAAGLQHDDGFAALRQELERFAHMIFSPRPGDRSFWLLETHNGEAAHYGGPKPCIHGCDAHTRARLFRPDGNRFCWIKADPTFEGLRQLMYEPGERVWIGETPPDQHDRSRTLQSVTITGANGWFEAAPLPLNPGLVTIIGRKGMGKSALNEIIAYAASAWPEGDDQSFIQRARPKLKGMRIRLNWADGRISERELLVKGVLPGKAEVRFLSQRFVEKLCADDRADGQLAKEIEAVIFAHLPPSETLNASSFEGLREKRTATIRQEQKRLIGELQGFHREIHELYGHALALPETQRRLAELAAERATIVEQMPQPTTEAEQQIAAELAAEQAALAAAIAVQAGHKEMLLRIDGVSEKVRAFQVGMDRFWDDISADLTEIHVPEEKRAGFKPLFTGDVKGPLDERRDETKRAIEELEGAEDGPAAGTIRARQAHVQQLLEASTLDEAKKLRLTEMQNRISAIDIEIQRVQQEIAAIQGSEAERLLTLRGSRRKTYADYFDTLRREAEALKELYRPLEEHLGAEHDEERQIKFDIRWNVSVDAWIERGMAMLDGRKTHPYRTQDEMKEAAIEHLLPGWRGDPAHALGDGIDRFLAPFGADPAATLPGVLRSNFSAIDFFEWLYSVTHIRLSYGLTYEGTALENLSPGTKGIVLLILYLAMDDRDTRPLLIDQPDENLDNESIYDLLAAYFRRSKRRRQILLITHNPNLVVNTDAEQIVVASCEKGDGGVPAITYESGAIENAAQPDGIRQQACRVLEGGETAFHQRERRYGLLRD